MTAAVALEALPEPRPRPVLVRPAPHREPPLDNERQAPIASRHDQLLPFERPATVPRIPYSTRHGENELPHPARWGRRLLVGVVEAASGHRPLSQLSGMLSPTVAHDLRGDFERAAGTRQRHRLHSGTVRSVRVFLPSDTAAELSATVAIGDRVRAVAARLESHNGRWQCVRLDIG
jgi:hypothetical protein